MDWSALNTGNPNTFQRNARIQRGASSAVHCEMEKIAWNRRKSFPICGCCLCNQVGLKGCEISGLAPLGEQSRIVAKVDLLMALCDELEAKIATNQATAHRFTEAVVAELAA